MSGKIDRTVVITVVCILLSVGRILPVGCGCSQLTRHQVNDWWFLYRHVSYTPSRTGYCTEVWLYILSLPIASSENIFEG
jgi:hypothetical protein